MFFLYIYFGIADYIQESGQARHACGRWTFAGCVDTWSRRMCAGL